jgi:ankyrin repeat protein
MDVDHPDPEGMTLLMWAAAHGQAITVNLLISHGADPNHVGPEGTTALLLAASSGHLECLKALLKAGASIDHHDDVSVICCP